MAGFGPGNSTRLPTTFQRPRNRHPGANQFQTAASRSSAAPIAASPRGRTSRSISLPSCSRISVGHSLTPNERPSGRPDPSAIRRWRTAGCLARAAVIAGRVALHTPHQLAPNSITAMPGNASTSVRLGSTSEYRACIDVSAGWLSNPHLCTLSTKHSSPRTRCPLRRLNHPVRGRATRSLP